MRLPWDYKDPRCPSFPCTKEHRRAPARPKAEMSPKAPSPFLWILDTERIAAQLLGDRRHAEASDRISAMVQRIAYDPRFTGSKIFLPGLDRLVERIGAELLTTQGADPPARDTGIPVIVATEVYADGGHTRIVEELARMLGGAVVILTNYFGGAGRPASRLPAAIGAMPAVVLPEDSAANSIVRLNALCRRMASEVFLLSHPHDVVANAALSAAMPAPVFFLHHCDHRPSLGPTIGSFVHVDLVRHMHAFCSAALQRPVQYWPQGVEDRGVRRFAEPFQAIGSACSGAVHKFAWAGPLAYPEVVRNLLASGVSSHYHIGELPEAALQQILAGLSAHAIPRERFHHVGQVRSLWQTLLELPVHVFVGSAPLHGLRTAIEVQGAGVPILPFRQPDHGLLSERGLYHEGVTFWSSPEELGERVREVLAVHREAARSARLHFERNFSTGAMKAAIDLAIARAAQGADERAGQRATAARHAPAGRAG